MLTCMILIFLSPISSRIGASSILLSYLSSYDCFSYIWIAILFRVGDSMFLRRQCFGHLLFSCFCFAVFLVSVFIRDRGFRRKSDGYNGINTAFLLRDNVYVLLFVLQIFAAIICFLQERKIVLANGYGGGPSEVIGSYNKLMKFSDDDVNLPGFASLIAGLQQGIAYILGYLFSMDRIHGSRKTYKVILFVLTVVC